MKTLVRQCAPRALVRVQRCGLILVMLWAVPLALSEEPAVLNAQHEPGSRTLAQALSAIAKAAREQQTAQSFGGLRVELPIAPAVMEGSGPRVSSELKAALASQGVEQAARVAKAVLRTEISLDRGAGGNSQVLIDCRVVDAQNRLLVPLRAIVDAAPDVAALVVALTETALPEDEEAHSKHTAEAAIKLQEALQQLAMEVAVQQRTSTPGPVWLEQIVLPAGEEAAIANVRKRFTQHLVQQDLDLSANLAITRLGLQLSYEYVPFRDHLQTIVRAQVRLTDKDGAANTHDRKVLGHGRIEMAQLFRQLERVPSVLQTEVSSTLNIAPMPGPRPTDELLETMRKLLDRLAKGVEREAQALGATTLQMSQNSTVGDKTDARLAPRLQTLLAAALKETSLEISPTKGELVVALKVTAHSGESAATDVMRQLKVECDLLPADGGDASIASLGNSARFERELTVNRLLAVLRELEGGSASSFQLRIHRWDQAAQRYAALLPEQSLALGDRYAIEFMNDANFDVAVVLTVGGVNVMAFSDQPDFQQLGRMIVPANKSGVIRGWHVGGAADVEEFVVVAADTRAEVGRIPDEMSRDEVLSSILATVYPAAIPDAAMAVDDSRQLQAHPLANLTTGRGARIPSGYRMVRQAVGTQPIGRANASVTATGPATK